MKHAGGIIVFCILFFLLFPGAAFSGTIDSATLSPSSATLQPAAVQTLTFSATNNKTFNVKTYHAEFTYTKGLNIANVVTTPKASKATVSTSQNLITFEWSSVAKGASVTATFKVSSSTAGTYSIMPKKISYIDNKNKTISGTCNSSQIVVQDNRPGIVSGTVSDISTGTPLENVDVTIVDAQQGVFTWTTPESGVYAAVNVPPGNFTASFSSMGYLDYTMNGTLPGGSEQIVNVLLSPKNYTGETIKPTDAFNPGIWLSPLYGFDTDVNTYASKNSVSGIPSISFGGSSASESVNAWQNKVLYWDSAWLYVTFEANPSGSADDLVELQVTDRLGHVKHTLLPAAPGAGKKGFAQKLQMSDWGDGFNNIGDLRLRVNGYRNNGADNGDAKVYDLRINGDLSPPVKNYSRGVYTSLPVGDGNMSTDYTPAEIRIVAEDDGNRVSQMASCSAGEYPMHIFKEKPSSRNIKIKWNGEIFTQGSTDAYAFLFKPGRSGRFTEASVYFRTMGAPNGTLRMRLKSELGGEVLAESSYFDEYYINSLGTLGTFTFDNPAYIIAGQTYYAEIWRDKYDIYNTVEIYSPKICPEIATFVRSLGTWYDEAGMGVVAVYIDNALDANSYACAEVVSGAAPVYGIDGLDWRTIYLEVYNRSTSSWVRLDQKLYDGTTSHIDLSGTVSLDAYFDTDGWTAVRVYADAICSQSHQWYHLATDSINFSAAGEISVTPLSLDFSSLMTNETSSREIQISNTGLGDLLIGNINISAVPFAITSDTCSGTTLLPSASCIVTVSFSPGSEGLFLGTLTIPSDDATQPVITIDLQGTGIPQPASMSGTVTDAVTGTPLQGVQITISDAAGSHSAISDAGGTYTLTGLKAGNIVAIFRKSGYIDQTVDRTLTSGQALILNIQLQRVPALTIIITAPQDGAVITLSPVQVTGTVSNVQAVDVNGIPASVAGGIFSISVPLVEGPNTITASASDQYGQTASQSIGVVFAPPKPPVISNVAAEKISADSGTITWTTDKSSDSRVEYGETTSYGSAAVDNQLATTHSVILSGLSPDKTYHFRVMSATSDGLSTSSADHTLTTLPFKATLIGDFGSVTVMEVTGNYDAKKTDGSINALPRQEIAKEFFKTHNDEYDFAIIVSNFDFAMPEASARASYLGIKNDTQGIGNVLFDSSALFGSNGKLQGMIDIGNISKHVTNPLDPNFDTTISLIAHEQMHRWGAYVRFKDASGAISTALSGKDGTHWSFLLDSDASLLYGNDWQDNGNGTFTSAEKTKYYSPLDLYLMGIYDKMQVPPMLLIDNPGIDPAKMPEVGATISGTARYVTIDDIIAAEGERVPNASVSQKVFKTAFILITTPGTFTGNELLGIENIRSGWGGRFAQLTGGKGTIADIPPAITVAAVSPLSDATVSGPDIMVKGAFFNSMGNETGIKVNGITATVYGNQFIANHLPLIEGVNTLVIVATDSAGNTATSSITVNAVTTGDYIRVTSNIESGISPLEVSLRVDGSFSVTNPIITPSGPGSIEWLTSGENEYRVNMTGDGTYYFTASATGPDGNTYQDTVAITVLNKTQLDRLLKAKWEGMKGALAVQNVEGALIYIEDNSKQAYREMFTALSSYLSIIAQELADIQFIDVKRDSVFYDIQKVRDGTEYSFQLMFIKDKSGVWKISSF